MNLGNAASERDRAATCERAAPTAVAVVLEGVAKLPVESLGLYHVFPGSSVLAAQLSEAAVAGDSRWPLEVLPVMTRAAGCRVVAFVARAADDARAAVAPLLRALDVVREEGGVALVRGDERLLLAACDELALRVDAIALEIAPFDERSEEGRTRAGRVRDRLARLRHAGVWVEVTSRLALGLPDRALLETALSLKAIDGAMPWHLRCDARGSGDVARAAARLIDAAQDAGARAGLEYVYAVSAAGGDSELTFCPVCRDTVLIERFLGRPQSWLVDGACCPRCRTPAHGLFERVAVASR